MEYRRLGRAGLKLSALSLGAWITYGGQVGEQVAQECMAAAYDAGVNFFDNAEAYAGGNAEIVMGNVIKTLGWRRESIVVSTWGSSPRDTAPPSGTSGNRIAIVGGRGAISSGEVRIDGRLRAITNEANDANPTGAPRRT